MARDNDESKEGLDWRQAGWGASRAGFVFHPDFVRARFGQRGWLRPAILKLLENKPMNGMEIMNCFYEASKGWWKPSPGSVYPLLEKLETEGLIKKKDDGKYEVIKEVTADVKQLEQVEEMITNMEGTVSYLEELAKSDRAMFTEYTKRIEMVADRLSRLKQQAIT